MIPFSSSFTSSFSIHILHITSLDPYHTSLIFPRLLCILTPLDQYIIVTHGSLINTHLSFCKTQIMLTNPDYSLQDCVFMLHSYELVTLYYFNFHVEFLFFLEIRYFYIYSRVRASTDTWSRKAEGKRKAWSPSEGENSVIVSDKPHCWLIM